MKIKSHSFSQCNRFFNIRSVFSYETQTALFFKILLINMLRWCIWYNVRQESFLVFIDFYFACLPHAPILRTNLHQIFSVMPPPQSDTKASAFAFHWHNQHCKFASDDS